MGLCFDWRWLSALCTIEPLILLVGLFFVPESPYFLVKKGQF
jgi:SP family facilitated glucose transporter-like MFS transporter 8